MHYNEKKYEHYKKGNNEPNKNVAMKNKNQRGKNSIQKGYELNKKFSGKIEKKREKTKIKEKCV